MTPTLLGRWQTRLFVLATVGLLTTAPFAAFFWLAGGSFTGPFLILLYVFLFGLGWDALYQYLQSFRWDHDWPPAFQLAAGMVEGLFLWGAIKTTFFWAWLGLNGLPGVTPALPLTWFVSHYGAVWLFTFLWTQGPMRIIFPRWRFRGGQWF